MLQVEGQIAPQPWRQLLQPSACQSQIAQSRMQVTSLHSTLCKLSRHSVSCISQVEGPHHPSALEAFPAAAGVADVNHGKAPGAGIGGDQRWQAPQEPAVPVKGEAFRKVEWTRESQ